MKKCNLYYGILAMASILTATSCTQDELVNESALGEYVTASFNITTVDGLGTRAIGDGQSVNTVVCEVYDAGGNKLEDLRSEARVENKKANIKFRLAKGKEYRVAFFAYDNEINAYNVSDLKNITVKTDNLLSNVEGRDAFTAYVDIEATTGAIEETVELHRPFAQLNLGIDAQEKEDAEKAGVTVDKSYIMVSGVYNAFSAYDNDVVTDATVDEMEFAMNTIPNQTLSIDGKEYTYLAMNYLLVPTEKTLTNVTFKWGAGEETSIEPIEFINIPLQRNYRTNIIGKLITTPSDFDIVIREGFGGEMNDSRIFSLSDLQAALDAAPVGETTVINLGADIVGDVFDFQKNDRNIVIDGRGHKYDGSIKIHNGSTDCNGSITIKNVNFETATKEMNFVMPNDHGVENGITRRYSQNVTVDSCTFTATGEAVNTAVGVQAKSCINLKVLNCTATDMHSLLQAQSCAGDVIVENAIINGKNGVAFKQARNAVVEGTTITAAEYGIRFDGNTDNYGITVKDNEVTASQPFIVRKMTGKDNTIALEGENTLTVSAASISTEAPAYQIVITNGSDDEAYVKPTGTYTLTGADNYLVYPRDYAHPVASWDEFTAALANEPKIKLTDNIEYSANYQLQKDVVIDLNGKSMTLPMINIHKNVTIKNGAINGKVYARNNSEIVFNNVKFSGAVADNLSTEGHLAIQGGCKSLYAKDCLFSPTSVSGSQTKPLSFEGGSTIMKFENCEFKSSPYKKQVYFNSLSATGSLYFANCNFNNKTPNIMFAAACPLTNLTMSGTTKLSSVTLETNRAKDAVTAEDLAYLRESLIANNSMSSVRLFYAGGSSEDIH